VRVRFLGSGDVVGSGGPMQTCILVEAGARSFLIDCGASSMIAMRRLGLMPNNVGLILLSHLHGDHFGGSRSSLLDAQLVSKRTEPLLVAGPPGNARRLEQATEALFPGLSRIEQRFSLRTVELEAAQPRALGGVTVTPYEVDTIPPGPRVRVAVEVDGRVLTYTGDTWTARRVVLTHMSQDMLDRLGTLDCETAEDGKTIEI
jgi:ribonuclease BN (tRNA processing enzyme)